MNIQEEKDYIYEMMRNVTKERSKLTDIYYGLKERLDFLFKMEQSGIEDLSLKGYIDYNNKVKTESVVRNIKRESKFIINNIEEKNSQEEIQESIIPKQVIVEEKIKEEKKNRKGKLLDTSKIAATIISILKEEGIPLHIKVIYQKLIEKDVAITLNNLRNNILPRTLKLSNKVERAMKGYYQYRA